VELRGGRQAGQQALAELPFPVGGGDEPADVVEVAECGDEAAQQLVGQRAGLEPVADGLVWPAVSDRPSRGSAPDMTSGQGIGIAPRVAHRE
jgi:hypothetical protein